MSYVHPHRRPAINRPGMRNAALPNNGALPQASPRAGSRARLWRRRLSALVVLAVVAMAVGGPYYYLHALHRKPSVASSQKNVPISPGDSFNKKLYSIDDPTSIWVVVNKKRSLNPINYMPVDLTVPNVPLRVPGNESMQLRKPAADGLEKLFAGAKADGLNLMLSSGYRSYTYQTNLYNGYVANSSVAEADRSSARPGHSEHQTGLAADVEPLSKTCEVDPCFAQTPEGKWIVANAYKYGFILRYPADKVGVTGYEYEPWHIRYVGTQLATELYTTHTETLEEFFGLGPAPSY